MSRSLLQFRCVRSRLAHPLLFANRRCVDEWLRSNVICPICKVRARVDAGDSTTGPASTRQPHTRITLYSPSHMAGGLRPGLPVPTRDLSESGRDQSATSRVGLSWSRVRRWMPRGPAIGRAPGGMVGGGAVGASSDTRPLPPRRGGYTRTGEDRREGRGREGPRRAALRDQSRWFPSGREGDGGDRGSSSADRRGAWHGSGDIDVGGSAFSSYSIAAAAMADGRAQDDSIPSWVMRESLFGADSSSNTIDHGATAGWEPGPDRWGAQGWDTHESGRNAFHQHGVQEPQRQLVRQQQQQRGLHSPSLRRPPSVDEGAVLAGTTSTTWSAALAASRHDLYNRFRLAFADHDPVLFSSGNGSRYDSRYGHSARFGDGMDIGIETDPAHDAEGAPATPSSVRHGSAPVGDSGRVSATGSGRGSAFGSGNGPEILNVMRSA